MSIKSLDDMFASGNRISSPAVLCENDSAGDTFEAKLLSQAAFQSNDLIRNVKKKYSTAGAKVLLYMASKIKKDASVLPLMIFDVRELCVAVRWDPQCRQNLLEMRTLLTVLTESKQANFAIKTKSGWEMPLPWLDKAIFKAGTTKVAIQMNSRLAPFFLQLTSNFTRIDSVIASRLRLKHSIAIYELAKSLQYHGGGTIGLDYLKEYLGIDEQSSYAVSVTNFMSKVVNPSVDEINKETDLSVSITPIKRGRKIDALLISVQSLPDAVTASILNDWNETLDKYRIAPEEQEAELREVLGLVNGCNGYELPIVPIAETSIFNPDVCLESQ